MKDYPDLIAPLEVGRRLAQLRERAGIKQGELARRVTWSPAVLSRIESGERALAADELCEILAAIGTPEADKLGAAVQRDWSVLPRPPLDHPDEEALWEAEQVARELVVRRDDPQVRNAFERRLSALLAELGHNARLLLKRDYQVAFIGSIGIGKSTAICRLTGLEIPSEDGSPAAPVLEAGAGGITLCEVHLGAGPDYGILVEPRSDEEIRADVTDFAEYLTKGQLDDVSEPQTSDSDHQGISKEIERAVRNMAGLKVRREKGADGKRTIRDEARELARGASSVRELVVEMLARMELHRRDRRDVWYNASSGKPPLPWLKDTFEHINNGRHRDFTLPKRVEVVVPGALLGTEDLSIRIVDTKGIDRTLPRADLESHLDEPHTLAVLCSGFNDAPAAAARLLLERACEVGVRSLDTHTALLVLPRPGEALAMKDESGTRVETPDEGYELKGEQVAQSLQPLGLENLAVGFFNAHQDSPERLREFLLNRVAVSRYSVRERLRTVAANARSVLANQERELVQEVIRDATRMLRTWTALNAGPRPLRAHIHDSLMEQLTRAHSSTIWASVRREGEWPNLSYSHHLGYGARRMAAMSLGPIVESFSELCRTMTANADFTEARDLINQSERVLASSYEDLLRKVQLMGQSLFREELKPDIAFWIECGGEWGRGSGYRDRVASRNVQWFSDQSRQELERELLALIEREWRAALANLESLFDTDG